MLHHRILICRILSSPSLLPKPSSIAKSFCSTRKVSLYGSTAASTFNKMAFSFHIPREGRRHMANFRWPKPRRPPIIDKALDLFYYKPEVLIGVASGGLIATAGGIGYYLYQKGEIERLRASMETLGKKKTPANSSTVGEAGTVTGGGGGGTPTIDTSFTFLGIPLPFITFCFWAMLTVVTASLARTKARMDLNYRQFANRVNFSLNSIAQPANLLRFRTIQEKTLDQVLLGNLAAKTVVLNAIKNVTSNQDPFLRFQPNENYFLMNALLNDLSGLNSTAFFQADRNMQVERVWYILGMTFEKNAPFKKIRVQIASEDLIQQILTDAEEAKLHSQQNTSQNLNEVFKSDEDHSGGVAIKTWSEKEIPHSSKKHTYLGRELQFEEWTHRERWDCLRRMAHLYKEHGANNPNSCLWKVEIAVPVPGLKEKSEIN